MNNKRIEDIENHMIVEDLIYDGDGFVRESDFIFDDDDITDTEEDLELLDVLKYRGDKSVIDVEGNN